MGAPGWRRPDLGLSKASGWPHRALTRGCRIMMGDHCVPLASKTGPIQRNPEDAARGLRHLSLDGIDSPCAHANSG
jgi:hypothetical protein